MKTILDYYLSDFRIYRRFRGGLWYYEAGGNFWVRGERFLRYKKDYNDVIAMLKRQGVLFEQYA